MADKFQTGELNRDGALRVAFIMEQTLGHVTHYRNLQRAVSNDASVEPCWVPIAFPPRGVVSSLPLVRHNWTLRGSLEAYRALRRLDAARRFNALFLHTQSISLFSASIMRRVPTVISLDATPLNYDSVGDHYGHRHRGGWVERWKLGVTQRAFAAAAAFTTWSQWAKDSLVRSYAVEAEKIHVVPPGTDLTRFPFGALPRSVDEGRLVRILFVGGDFERKGGQALLDCFLRGFQDRCKLHLVTRAGVPASRNMHVYNDVEPNSETLLRLYREADFFVMPTLGDCLAVVLGEAMAAGLPIITTSVGAHREAVIDGESGFVIPPGDQTALHGAIAQLVENPQLRLAMGRRGRQIAEERFASQKNGQRIVDLLREVSTAGPAHREEKGQ